MNRLSHSSRLEAARILTARAVGDESLSCATKLSAERVSDVIRDVLESARKKNFVTQAQLCAEAGISTTWYRHLLADPGRGSRATYARLQQALRRLIARRHQPDDLRQLESNRMLYGVWLAAVCPFFDTTPAAVYAADPRACKTGNVAFLQASRARQAAIYLAHTSSGVPQRALARAVGVTEAAVCQAVRRTEARRAGADFDRLLDRIHAEVTGRLAP